jgi:hypothetical protein
VTSTDPLRKASLKSSIASSDKAQHDKAYALTVSKYEKDPAYWFDMLCHCRNTHGKGKDDGRAVLALDKLNRLGWEVEYIGKI